MRKMRIATEALWSWKKGRARPKSKPGRLREKELLRDHSPHFSHYLLATFCLNSRDEQFTTSKVL